MTMKHKYYINLYEKLLSNSLSEREKAQWYTYINDPENQSDLQHLLDEHWRMLDERAVYSYLPAEREDKLVQEIFWLSPKTKRRFYFAKWQVGAAASAIAATLIAVWFMALHLTGQDQVLPGGNHAYVVLEDGTRVDLDEQHTQLNARNGLLQYTDGQLISAKLHTDRSNKATLVTPRGGQYQIILQDGTRVWLNADSQLEYPTTFAAEQPREVYIKGEAYFEVAHDKKRPFIVNSPEQRVNVLGTKFVVSAYNDVSGTQTTLLSGSVELRTTKQRILLEPNQQAVLDRGTFHVKPVHAQDELAWIKGEFVFNNETLQSISEKLERWYKVEFIFSQERLKDVKIAGTLSRFEQIDEVLELLSQVADVKFERDNRDIHVYDRERRDK